jgi:hypothetical protein
MDLKGSGCDKHHGTILAFVRKDLGTSLKSSDRTAGVLPDILTEDLLNNSVEHYRYANLLELTH